MDFYLYDSRSKAKKKLQPQVKNHVYIYVCGPTVYNHAHIGNARPLIVFDTLRRALLKADYKVTFISNYTDVDDKIINQAIKENTSEKAITDKYIQAYSSLRKAFNVLEPTITPRVTECMNDIIQFVQDLIDKGYAYEIDGDVYFRVSKIKEYGEISNKNLEELQVGARIEENTKKENPLDFTLWKKTDLGIKWDTIWSIGRPGWHSECVVMIKNHTPNLHVDIHGGGMDLKFPHHENEQAQCYAYSNHELASIWMHNGLVNINNEKMSKSLNNFILAKDLIEKYGGQLIRWVMLSTHYRAPINFTDEVFNSSANELKKIYTTLKQASLKLSFCDNLSNEINRELFNKFLNELSDDLNTSSAISILFETVKMVNQLLRTPNTNLNELNNLFNTVNEMLDTLGMEKYLKFLNSEEKDIYLKWQEFKTNKDFENADKLRNELINRGII